MNLKDTLIGVVERGVRTVFGVSDQPDFPGHDDTSLAGKERRDSIALMRINHCGEVCAQALYTGQALTARSNDTREALTKAAEEEEAHLHWCRQRLRELGGRPSVLDPVFYAASTAIGAAVGLMGDRTSLGFVEATEDQVTSHLDRHLKKLSPADERSRDILERIKEDESRHGASALQKGGTSFSPLARQAMTLASRLMTETTRRV